ncbi:MAG TPA: hypothetical protein VM717_07825 [Chthoniobacterales bacterium]|jgi:hypothetical protein|nr:hypothetical protein [Chthoniobacterales bacterium]
MKTSTRFIIIATSLLLCAGGIFIAHSASERIPADNRVTAESVDTIVSTDGYQFAASRTPKLTFQQLETIIRRDPVPKSQHGRIEFGSVRMDEGSALAEVMFVSNDGRVQPFLYKLLAEHNSWKVVNVQRMWYIPQSHLLRGVRA